MPGFTPLVLDTVSDDPFVFCPYDRKHRVPRSRLQAHIVRCEQKYPPLAICPYNATHRMPADQIMLHVQDCETRLAMLPEGRPPHRVIAPPAKPTPQKDHLSDEFWDD